MLNIDSIQNGIVIDHIKAGTSMRLYELLHLADLDCCVAVIKNARSIKYGKKDIIKIEGDISLDLEILGFVDPNITVVIIQNGKIAQKQSLVLPRRLKNVAPCKNPRCITCVEEEIDNLFILGEDKRYRCVYCEQELHP